MDYERCTRTSDHFFENKNGDVGCIKKILVIKQVLKEKVIILYHNVRLYSNFLENRHVKVDHIRKCSKPLIISQRLRYCEPSDIRRPCIFLPTEEKNYMSFVLRGCLGD